jgi:glucokinase
MYFLGIEIGGTKLQLGVGDGQGVLACLWRGTVNPAAGPEGIRKQIIEAVPTVLDKGGVSRSLLYGVGIGFGGPVDDANRTIIKSHQIDGWDHFPLADWISDLVGLPAVLGNDADVAGLAEALYGAGKGLSPIFYITIGSGIGGGLIIEGEIYRGVGRGAAEIGHLRIWHDGQYVTLESIASGWGMERQAVERGRTLTVPQIAEAAAQSDPVAGLVLETALNGLAEAICHVIALLCPRRIVIGGGVSLLGEAIMFEPLRLKVAQRIFRSFVGLTDLVQAALGEEVVVHGALALARQKLGFGKKGEST